MSRTLLLAPERSRMRANGRRLLRDRAFDPCPVVRLVQVAGAGHWLLAALDPRAPTRAYGLYAPGTGTPVLGWVDLLALAAQRRPAHDPVRRDPHFVARHPLSTYATHAGVPCITVRPGTPRCSDGFGTAADAPVPHVTQDPTTGLPWPVPLAPEPDFITLAGFLFEGAADATDGCHVPTDGICPHGHPSWLLRLGVM